MADSTMFVFRQFSDFYENIRDFCTCRIFQNLLTLIHVKTYDFYLFDFDGTLVDSLNSLMHVFANSFQDIGISITREECLTFSRQPIDVSYYGKGGTEDKFFYFIDRINYYLNSHKAVELTELFEDTIPLIRFLQDNRISCGIVTSNNIPHVKEVLDFFHLPHELFMVYTGNQETDEFKPSPKPILKALKIANYKGKKSNVAYIGDGLNDMLSAKNAGVEGILIDRVNAFEDSADYIRISSLMDLFK